MSIKRIEAFLGSTPVVAIAISICGFVILLVQHNLARSDINACFQRDAEIAGIWRFPDKNVYFGVCGYAFDANGAPVHYYTLLTGAGEREVHIDWPGTPFHDRFHPVKRGETTELSNNFGAHFAIRRVD